jgi:hypothetical protein
MHQTRLTQKNSDIHLLPWQEIIGKFVRVQTSGANTNIIIDIKGNHYKIKVPKNDVNVNIKQGSLISVIKTDESSFRVLTAINDKVGFKGIG